MEASKMTHSHSQPGGMDRTPPGTPKKGGKMLAVRVQMLDDTVTIFQVQAKALGRVLFDQVCNQLNLLESDYFGLEYQEAGGTKYWLDLEKPLCRQIGLSLVDTLVRFCVKFYTPDPSQLEEEFTRYLFCLQIKRDLSQGLLQCNNNTAALMASYIVQAECGDYVVEDYPDHRYLSSYKFVPNQDQELERRIMENHKKHAGQTPAEADLNLLETARRCELYGIKMHPAKDHEGCPLNLAVAHMGIVVFQNVTKINTFSWAKIRKISFKRKRFLVKLHPEGYGYYKDTVEFFFDGRNECKNFWKKCVENHGFFRCTMVKKVPRQKTRVLSRGSSFRYSGRTQKQIVDFVRENYVKRQTFQRSQSFRHSSSAHSSVANVGTSISAHPLLPLGDNAVAGTPASLSCGSMTLTSSPVHAADIHAGASPSPPLTTSVSPGTSVTSSPQHFYPQETHFRRAGHRPAKVRHPPARTLHAISPLSTIDAATAASNLSANHSNSIVVVDNSDVISSRNSLKSPEFVDFNDVYSNCYTSLRSLENGIGNNKITSIDAETDIFSFPREFFEAASTTGESIKSLPKTLAPSFSRDKVDLDANRYTWHRSASCEEVYHDDNVASENEREKIVTEPSKHLYNSGVVSSVKIYDKSIRKSYSAITSKHSSIDRTGEAGSGSRVFSSSYPGTTSSLSTESPEGDLDDRIVEILDVKYDSQEEIALSHDDVSHDSYELLERELDDCNDDESSKNKRSRIIGDNERTRSCSWGSDRGISPLDFRSSEIAIGPGFGGAKEQNFWSLEREKNLKHKSEIDFRSLNHRTSKGCRHALFNFEGNKYDSKEKPANFFDYNNRFGKVSREKDGELFDTVNRKNQMHKRMLDSKSFEDKEFNKAVVQEIKLRKVSREEKEGIESFERKKSQSRRKSLEELAAFDLSSEDLNEDLTGRLDERKKGEKRRDKREREERFHEGFKEKEPREWDREMERRSVGRRRSTEEKDLREGEELLMRKAGSKSCDYVNFQEIQFQKFERVVSNQFGKYPEFLTSGKTYEYLTQEKKVVENYEKMYQVSRLAKELKQNENNFASGNGFYDKSPQNVGRMKVFDLNSLEELSENQELKKTVLDSNSGSNFVRAHVERTKSDPYNSLKNQRKYILMHQKSIDLTPQYSEETTSDYDNEDVLKKAASRSEHDIPYILHKRHCMNGTARVVDLNHLETSVGFKTLAPETGNKKLIPESKNSSSEEVPAAKQKLSSARVAEAKKAGVEIINLDVKNDKCPVNTSESKKVGKFVKASSGKKSSGSATKPSSPKTVAGREVKKAEHSGIFVKARKNSFNCEKSSKMSEEPLKEKTGNEEPIYAEVCPEKTLETENSTLLSVEEVPPDPPKRTSSASAKPEFDDDEAKPEKKKIEKKLLLKTSLLQELKEPPNQKTNVGIASEAEAGKTCATKIADFKAAVSPKVSKSAKVAESGKSLTESVRSKQDLSFSNATHHRREESLTLFARTRLGLSEGSAFTPIVRQGRVGSPSSQRRAKSLDAPYISVHSLPPADAFSSKDDTVDEKECYLVDSAVARFEELCKGEPKKERFLNKRGDGEPPGNTESEVDSVFTDELEVGTDFKKAVEIQSRVEIPALEEKILDGVRGKRLLSKIESVDFIDSEGDLDSSKMAEPPPIPSDRLVNLPESIRFPSVRQISGQTSEESADGWDQREVKVKRRTPRRSVGREEQSDRAKESVVWDSKDDEPPDDDVWEDNMTATRKFEGVVVNVGLPTEYLKRGSCGQSIDDDNLSTPMKESSPEHWVSVDDLPEALEKEEKLLKQQEKLLREKILNEKLKRELNLDTIDVDERYCDYRDSLKHSKYEEEPVSLKENFKGHSLDTYELNEKKMRERGGNKNSSLDEELLPNKLINSYGGLDFREKMSAKSSHHQERLDYIQCKVVKDVAEIDRFGDNDEELEEFFVVLDENLGKEGRTVVWDEEDSFRRTFSNDESLISVPEEFKDVEKEESPLQAEENEGGGIEIRLSEVEVGASAEGRISKESLILSRRHETEDVSVEDKKTTALEGGGSEEFKMSAASDVGRLSPFDGSRRGSEDNRKLSLSEETGRLSPYDNASRRSSDDPRRFSASEDAGRLSPFDDSRRGSEDPRPLSTSEDSRKCSASESVSEETRRRLSSTEETRRKRASLTKQCSVGAESISDEVISGIQECSSSFEHDERDVFESESANAERDVGAGNSITSEIKSSEKVSEKELNQMKELRRKNLEVEVREETPSTNSNLEFKGDVERSAAVHLAPPTTERELSRETEDSVDYGEGDFRDIREVVKEKEISEGLICDNECASRGNQKLTNSFEKSESCEGDELRYIDDKRGSTPEILMGKSREAFAVSIVVVNEGISVLKKMNEKDGSQEGADKTRSLPGGSAGRSVSGDVRSRTLPEAFSKPKPLTPKPAVDQVHRKLAKTVSETKVKSTLSTGSENSSRDSVNLLRSSLDSSQESDLDKLSDLSLISHVQNQIAKRNLADIGKYLKQEELIRVDTNARRSSEIDGSLVSPKVSAEEKEKTESSSFELKSSADELMVKEDVKKVETKAEKRSRLRSGCESHKGKREGSVASGKDKRSPDLEKRDSGEDGSSSSSAPLYPKRELSSTWKPFLLESSGSSSLEEGWLPPDENAHLADEEETSSTSNNQQDESCHDEADYPTGIGYPVLNLSSAEMMVSGYGSVYALSRTLSRISERSTSEQERSDLEDDITKPSSQSASVEEESIMSSDRQPSLSSDPPSPKGTASVIPDLPVDRPASFQLFEETANDQSALCEPFGDVVPPPLPEEDWPSPPSSYSVLGTPVVSHVETFYIEIHPEEPCKVVVAERQEEGNSSSDENQTLQEESEFLHLSSDNVSISTTTTTTQDGTVVIPVRPLSGRTGSFSEDASMISVSEWSSSGSGKPRTSIMSGASENTHERTKGSGRHDWQISSRGVDSYSTDPSNWPTSPSKYCAEGYFDQDSQKAKLPTKVKPLKLSSPTAKTFGFFETPVSKVRSPTSQTKFFESKEREASGFSSLRSPTSVSETSSPKNYGRFFDGPGSQILTKSEACERRTSKSPTRAKAGQRGVCTPYYSNVADSAERSYFGRYDTGSLERTKINSSRKCCSYYSVSKTAPTEGDSSNSEGPPAPSPNTIPRASRKTKRRHRVAMDLVVRDGKIITPPRTKTTVVENSDSDRSSPRSDLGREARKHSDV